MNAVYLKIRRRAHPDKASYWEDFQVPFTENMTIAGALNEIARFPVNARDDKTTPVVWENHCQTGPCGTCAMLVNGQFASACQYVISKPGTTLTLEPLQKFPVLKDLLVDRSRMALAKVRVRSWFPIDGTYHAGIGPRLASKDVPLAQTLASCTNCGACLEVCPQITENGGFIGAAITAGVYLANLHPTGLQDKRERLMTLLEKEGLEDCRLSGNCERSCPEKIPLTTIMAQLNREATVTGLFGWLS